MTHKNFKYALVSGIIIQYDPDSLSREVSEWDDTVFLVKYLDRWGMNCVTPEDNFQMGSLEQLQSIVQERKRVHQEKVRGAYEKFPHASVVEKQIIEFMISDGYTLQELTYEGVQAVTRATLEYCECNGSLRDAYMDYMH